MYTGRYYDDCFGTSFGDKTIFGLKSPAAETEFLENFGQEKRSFKMVTFDTGNYPESEQVKFGKANPDKFIKYDMSIITVEDKSTADKVLSRISKGQITFEDAVAEYSEKYYSESDGTLSNKSQYQIENILKEKDDLSKVTALVQDEMSPAIETLVGFSIFKNNGSSTQPDFTSEDTLKDIQNYISTYETSVIEDYFSDIAKDFVKEVKTGDFDTVIAKYENASVDELAAFPLNYGSSPIYDSMDTSTIKVLANADTNEDFLKQAFTLKLNEYSDPIILGGNIVVLQYTGSESVEKAEDAEPSNFASQLVDFDQSTMQDVVFKNPKFENNFITVYFDNFINTSY